MCDRNDRLQKLNAKRLHLKQLGDMLDRLEIRRRELVIQEYKLKQALREEQADVQRLQGFTLTSLLNTFAGKKEKKLAREQEEACRVELQHAAAASELAGIEAQIRKCRQEADALQYSQAEFEKLLAEKTGAVRSSASPLAQELLSLEKRIAGHACAEDRIMGALEAGKKLRELSRILKDDYIGARGICTMDMLFTRHDLRRQKHAWMESIEENAQALRSQLLYFSNVLAEIGQDDEELRVELESFQQFMKQGVWFGWTNLDLRAQLVSGIRQIEEFEAKLKPLIEDLENLLKLTVQRRDALQEECRMLVAGARDS